MENNINALGKQAAYQLANVTKTPPQFAAITPKWLTRLLEFKGLESGIYRVNKVVEGKRRSTFFARLKKSPWKSPKVLSITKETRASTYSTQYRQS